MHFTTLATPLALALAGTALAKDINVAVGRNGTTFSPEEITAEEGDVVWFKFWPKSHSVAQAAFDRPCEPLDGGFWSGYVNTTDTEKAAELNFMYTVTNASAPVWFYCTRGDHCQQGMVGVINPPQNPERTLQAFKDAAAEAQQNLAPTGTPTQEDGIMLMNGTEHGDDGHDHTEETPAASSSSAAGNLPVKDFAVSGVFGLLAYMLF